MGRCGPPGGLFFGEGRQGGGGDDFGLGDFPEGDDDLLVVGFHQDRGAPVELAHPFASQVHQGEAVVHLAPAICRLSYGRGSANFLGKLMRPLIDDLLFQLRFW